MLLEYYGLREQPFGVTPNPRYLYLSPTHREALASLLYGIEAGRGFMALVAKPGMGKTTLLFHVLEQLGSSARTVFLFQTHCNAREFLRGLMMDLGLEADDDDLVRLNARLNQVLVQEMRAGRRFVLVIDEAQNLEDSVLEVVRMLSNFETARAKLMQIVLVGQPQLANTLARPGMVQLRQRISIISRLHALSAAETSEYIDHRLKVAGHDGRPLFSAGARTRIAVESEGIPRNINNLCFNAMSLAYALGSKSIDSRMVEEVVGDLSLNPEIEAAPAPLGGKTWGPAPAATTGPASGDWAVLLDKIVSSARATATQPYRPAPQPRIQLAEGRVLHNFIERRKIS